MPDRRTKSGKPGTALNSISEAINGFFGSLSGEALTSAKSSDILSTQTLPISRFDSAWRYRHKDELERMQPYALYTNRAAALIQLKEYQAALEDAELAILMNPEWYKGFYRRAEARSYLGQYEEALVDYRQAVQKDRSGRSLEALTRRIEHTQFMLQDVKTNLKVIQLLSGRDFCVSSWSPINALVFNYGRMLQNFVYAIGCRVTKQCYLVDACWDLDAILSCVKAEGYQVVGAIVTHYHFDHVGGKPPKPFDQYPVKVDGVASLLRRMPQIKAYIHEADIKGVLESNPDINMNQVEPTSDGFELTFGRSIHIKFIHTPGHTPGSQCLLVNKMRLFSGDTLFIDHIGRLDFPDSDVQTMFHSMQKLRNLNDGLMVYPGHNYGGSFTVLGREKQLNMALRCRDLPAFMEYVSATNASRDEEEAAENLVQGMKDSNESMG